MKLIRLIPLWLCTFIGLTGCVAPVVNPPAAAKASAPDRGFSRISLINDTTQNLDVQLDSLEAHADGQQNHYEGTLAPGVSRLVDLPGLSFEIKVRKVSAGSAFTPARTKTFSAGGERNAIIHLGTGWKEGT